MSSSAQYQCLCCGYEEKIHCTKEDYSEVKVCPKCNGALVDTWHRSKYKTKKFNERFIIPEEHALVIVCDGVDKLKVWKDGKELYAITELQFDIALRVKAPELKITQFILGDDKPC